MYLHKKYIQIIILSFLIFGSMLFASTESLYKNIFLKTFPELEVGANLEGFPLAFTTIITNDINYDNIDDYIVIADFMGHEFVLIVDGKDNSEIWSPTEWSKIGIPVEIKVTNLISDTSKEIVIQSGGGGTVEQRYELNIYSFFNNQVILIYNEVIACFPTDKKTSKLINYIKYLDIDNDNAKEVLIYKGRVKNKNACCLNISKKSKKPYKIYKFRNEDHKYEPVFKR